MLNVTLFIYVTSPSYHITSVGFSFFLILFVFNLEKAIQFRSKAYLRNSALKHLSNLARGLLAF